MFMLLIRKSVKVTSYSYFAIVWSFVSAARKRANRELRATSSERTANSEQPPPFPSEHSYGDGGGSFIPGEDYGGTFSQVSSCFSADVMQSMTESYSASLSTLKKVVLL